MKTQKSSSKTVTTGDPSPSKPFLSQEILDGLPQASPLMADSLSGPSSVSSVAVDSFDLETILKIFLDEETVAIPHLSEKATSTDNVFLSTSQPPSLSSSEFELSQPLGLIPYDSKKQENFGSGYFTWTPWPSNPLCPSKEAFRTENEPTGVGAGLENLGNTCFMNAVLQCFTHTVPFVLALRSLNHHENPCGSESFCLLCAFHDHIELSLNLSGGVVLPSKIFDNLNYISSSFQKYQQEDAHEFLQCLLDKLGRCWSDSKPKDHCLSSPDDCLVKKVFGGRLVSKLCCCNCAHISYRYEPWNDLSLEIADVDTLPSALESFTKVEKLDDLEAKFRCENCKEKVSVEKQLMLDQAPTVATFHLKRFKTEGTSVEKIDKHIVFPLELDLQPYVSVNQTNNEELKYQLSAFVKHSGLTPTSGHYVCYIRSSPDAWHKLDDSIVTSIEEEEVLSQEAYILFYSRQGIPWFSTAIEVQKPSADHEICDSSPKSVIDDIEHASNPQLENSTDCNANESKDVADKNSTQISYETQFVLELDELCVATDEGISGLPVSESEFHVSKCIDFRDDNPMSDASLPLASSDCSDEFDKNISTVSNLEENNCSRGVYEAKNDSSFPSMPFRSQCPDKCQRDSSGCAFPLHLKDKKRDINRRAVNRTVIDQRIKAMRHTRRMPTRRRAKFTALLGPQIAGKMKKRTGSSACKRVSPRL